MTDTSALPARSSPQNNLAASSEEPVWVRYSSHGELPLSSATSFVLHGLVIGLAFLAVWMASHLFDRAARSIPVETVVLMTSGPSKTNGPGNDNGPGNEAGREVRDGASPEGADDNPPEQQPSRPVLPNPKTRTPKPLPFNPDAPPTPHQDDSDQAFQNLRVGVARLSSGPTRNAPKSGPIGNKGPSSGKPRTQTEKRMARWAMHFDTRNGPDYLRQLAALGADLAFAITPGRNPTYRVVRNKDLLHPPAALGKEDLDKYKGIRWVDEDEKSVAQIVEALGLKGKVQTTHFIAFLPAQLEDKLAKLEKDYANRKEDDIAETHFQIRQERGRYTPVVIEQKGKGGPSP